MTGSRRPPRSETRVEIGGHDLVLTNLDKVLYPAVGFTKAEVIDYFAAIAPTMLPHLAGRAVTLVRFPNGVEESSFFEKRCPPHHPDWIPEVGTLEQCGVSEPAALVWLANLAALELHCLQAKAATPDVPDALVLDLDPGPPAGMLEAAAVALELAELLVRLDLVCVVKTSGSKGLHLSVPLHTPTDSGATRGFAKALGDILAKRMPDRVTTEMTRAVRPGKVFVDWSQNSGHKTTVCAYSLRGRSRPTVSTPVAWHEVEAAVDAGDDAALSFIAPDVITRVANLGDLYLDNLEVSQELPVT